MKRIIFDENNKAMREILQELPEEIEAIARNTKAFVRARKVKNVTQLLRMVLLYCGSDKTFREIAAIWTCLYEERITDSSVMGRLEASSPWVKEILKKLLDMDGLKGLPGGYRFLVIDGSCVQGPGAKQADYRIHACMDLKTLEFPQIYITDRHTGESLNHFKLGLGDVAIVDRGYCDPDAIVQQRLAGADLILRLNPWSVPLEREDGSSINIIEELRGCGHGSLHTFVGVVRTRDGKRAQGWVHAYRLPQEAASRARQKCLARYRKQGRTPGYEVLFLCEWILIWTSLLPRILSPEVIVKLYGFRWQIEVAIKRWKSILDVGELRSRYNSSSFAELWLHGKLLYAWMVNRWGRKRAGSSWGWLDNFRSGTWWRVWKLVKDHLLITLTGVLNWKPQAWSKAMEVLCERPRQRNLQQLPCEVIELLRG